MSQFSKSSKMSKMNTMTKEDLQRHFKEKKKEIEEDAISRLS